MQDVVGMCATHMQHVCKLHTEMCAHVNSIFVRVTSFQFCIVLVVWSANSDAPFLGKFQVNLLNDNTYRWNCATSSYGQIE